MLSFFFKKPLFLVPAILAAFLLSYIYFDGLSVLVIQWLRLDEYWRFLIVPVSLFFIWNKRKELQSTPVEPSIITGIAIIVPGCVAYLLWKIIFIDFFIEIGLFLIALGFISLLFGNRLTRLFLLPLGYLVLMTSIVERILAPITILMQYASAMATSVFMNNLGWEVIRDGRMLRLPGTILEVASECSGVGQLTALIAFAIPLGVLMLRSFFPRMLLLLTTIPLALLVNTIRIILICAWNYDSLKTAIHGPHEILRMPFIYPLALVFMYLFALFLSRFENRRKNSVAAEAKDAQPVQSTLLVRALYGAAAFLAITLGCSLFMSPGNVHFVHSLAGFPKEIGAWKGDDVKESSVGFYFGRPDEAISRFYRGPLDETVSLYIARFDRQSVRKRVSSVQSPLFAEDERITSIESGHGLFFPARLTGSKTNRKMTTLSWFSIDADTYPALGGLRKKIALNGLFKKRNDAALVAISSDFGNGAANEDVLRSFAASAYPEIKKILETIACPATP
jgi:EpsI family protein